MFKLDLERGEEPEIKLPTSAGSSKQQESSRKTSISALLTMPKPSTLSRSFRLLHPFYLSVYLFHFISHLPFSFLPPSFPLCLPSFSIFCLLLWRNSDNYSSLSFQFPISVTIFFFSVFQTLVLSSHMFSA